MKSLVATLAEEYEQKIITIKQDCQREISKIASQNEKLRWEINSQNNDKLDLERQIERLSQEVGELYKNLHEEKAARRLLISDLNSRNSTEVKPTNEKEQIDALHMKIALEQNRKDLAVARKEIMEMEADYVNVVPKRKFDKIEEELNQKNSLLSDLEKNYRQVTEEHSILRQTYAKVYNNSISSF